MQFKHIDFMLHYIHLYTMTSNKHLCDATDQFRLKLMERRIDKNKHVVTITEKVD